jgi:hypothetical protein
MPNICRHGHTSQFQSCSICRAAKSNLKLTINPEQIAFEKYYSDDGQHPSRIDKHSNGVYKLVKTYEAWVVWQARAGLGGNA